MRIRTRIAAMARARGLTAAEVARRLGWYRSNVSAMDAGHRSVSVRALARLSQVLGCGPADLLEMIGDREPPVFPRSALNQRLRKRDEGTPDGLEKAWVHTTTLAWQRHYGARTRAR